MATVKKTTTAIEETPVEKVPKTTPKKSIFNLFSLRKNLKKWYGKRPRLYLGIVIILIILIGLSSLFWFNKSLFLAGNINGRVLTSLQFYSDLKKAAGEKVFDSIVRETLVKQEAAKLGISVSNEDIDKKIQEIEKRLGGKENLDKALAQNQATAEDLREQITMQVLVEKILEKQIAITDADVDKYIADNKEDTAKLTKEEVKETVKSEKINEKFGPWYEELQSKAKITRYF
ncbi:hypothetical protein A2Z23_02970 [Candidatus Curtissbacteria bacterium RBG_16_39_7]|uniref:peptidylprolyl isomerase n=1 Tax=Candidatus Curtissbacteria bacterium RBG_16_39_7 TaxID=1797707 RepID=A0A1F5G258_9BACT|nr:MAG: hypothetical protein A2Z23_02970 [Candidatus Curtissbacteria bacterium RBG_16_39_7]